MKHYTFVDYATQGYSAVVALMILLFHNATVPHWGCLLASHGVVLIGIHALVHGHARGRGGKVVDFLRYFYPVLIYTWFFAETGWLNRMFFTEFLDPVIVRWDQAVFGCQPSLLFMRRFPYLLVSELFYASYFCYYVMIAGVGIALFVKDRRQFVHYISVISFVFYICYLVYIAVPVIGPRVFFEEVGGYILPEEMRRMAGPEEYPAAVQGGVFFRLMAWIYRVFEAPGSAIPSSHVAIAVCTVYFSFKYLRRIRWIHLVVVILLCLATVYCHYHYAVDVLAGLATAALLIPIGNGFYRRSLTRQADRDSKPPE